MQDVRENLENLLNADGSEVEAMKVSNGMGTVLGRK